MTFSKHSNLWRKIALASALLGLPSTAMAEWGLNLTRGVTPYANTVYDLHMLVLGLCVVIGVVAYSGSHRSVWPLIPAYSSSLAKSCWLPL